MLIGPWNHSPENASGIHELVSVSLYCVVCRVYGEVFGHVVLCGCGACTVNKVIGHSFFAATVNAAGQGGKTPLHMAASGVLKQVKSC